MPRSKSKSTSKSKTIDAYRQKRDFERTPEPPPGELRERAGTPSFVVHRHEARRLHYDLRLEMEGVLKSWAVPRGFSYDPKVKRLAVRTEDHPLEYESFEGVIPKDAYGAGTMTIWDRGHYQIIQGKDGPQAVEAGKLEITLLGKRLRGEWHLVRTKPEKDEWLLFKAKDRYSRDESEPAPHFELRDAVESAFPQTIEVMEAEDRTEPFSDPQWVFEMNFDGRRLLARKRNDEISLMTPGGTDWSSELEEVRKDLEALRAENAILDGVLVALDDAQRPSRSLLEGRLEGTNHETVFFYAFDILYYEDWDLRPLPLLERKSILASVLPRLPHVLYVDHVQSRGKDLFEVTTAAGLPGVIAKEASSRYQAGRSLAWRVVPARPDDDVPRKNVLEALEKAAPGVRARKIKFSNLKKVFWPREGYTKGDLIAYYEQVAELLLPYLHQRPVHMLRYPDGIEGKSFYQKDAPDHVPDWIETESIDSEHRGEPIRFIVCNDRDTLLYLINLGSIDLHPWLSRRGSLDSPDWAVLDLDPDESPFSQVVKVARTLGKVLRGIGLRPYLKTSGASGLHIYVPLEPGYTYDHAVRFCEAIARHVAQQHGDIATVERVVSRREGKVYIDFLQNRRGQTVVPPYVVRPVPGASVSAPLDWDELDSELHPSQFTLKTILPRLARLGDLFRGTLHDPQSLLPAIDAFQRTYLKR